MNKKRLFIAFTLLFFIGFAVLYYEIAHYTKATMSIEKSFIISLGITLGIIALNFKHVKEIFKQK